MRWPEIKHAPFENGAANGRMHFSLLISGCEIFSVMYRLEQTINYRLQTAIMASIRARCHDCFIKS